MTKPRDETESVALLVLGTALIATGTVLLVERVRADGLHRLWPLILVLLGASHMAVGSFDGRDEGWWMVAFGSRLLMNTLTTALPQQAVSLAVVATGVVSCRHALARRFASPVPEESHVC
jgi:hypothetical protein